MLQQRNLTLLLEQLREQNWKVEVETNGTIEPTDEFIQLVSQFNCSPKLQNSGPDNPLEKRIKSAALMKLVKSQIATFKFVITCWLDMIEVHGIIKWFDINPDDVYLMAEGKTREEQERRQGEVFLIAQSNGFHFSPRLHVLEFGNRRGV